MATFRQRTAVAALVILSLAVHARTAPQQKTAPQKPVVTVAGERPIASIEGKDNYHRYCAVCHGSEGKGDGPAAPAMKTPVPDLTLIAKRHNGKFDAIAIERVVKGTDKSLTTPAHGVESMPIWGDFFRNNGSEDPARTTLRVGNLVKYLQSIQR